jgi:imidazolonepropionase-like amidohydrolase
MYMFCALDITDDGTFAPEELVKLLSWMERDLRAFCDQIADQVDPVLQDLYLNLPITFLKMDPHMNAAALLADIHSIENGIYLDDEAIELMIENDTYLVPNLLAPVGVLKVGENGGMPDYGLRKVQEVVEIHSESIARVHKAGVKIAMSTDSAVTPHGQKMREIGLIVEIGMSPMQAVLSSTCRAAECLGWDNRLGTLEPGKLADLVISKSDPPQDIHSLENVDNIPLVMKDGKIL